METRTIETLWPCERPAEPTRIARWIVALAEQYNRDPILWALVCRYRREGRPLPRHFATAVALRN